MAEALEALACTKRLKKQSLAVQGRIDKLATRVGVKVNKEDRVTPEVPRDSSVAKPSAVDFSSPRNPF